MQMEAARIVSTPSPKHAPRDIHQPIVTQLVFHMAPNPADIVKAHRESSSDITPCLSNCSQRISQGTIQLEKRTITGSWQWRKMRPTSSSR
ncbi:hypothetical protein FIBSPDRAFT_869601, partial [Athelia psychrophila]